jgi:uncharacterized protein (TIGR00297 family)
MTAVTPVQLAIAAGLAAIIAVVSCILRWLTVGGAIAAFLVGFISFAAGGMAFAAPLLTFFITSSALSAVGKRRKATANSISEKQGARDAWQVLANGGVATVLALLFMKLPATRQIALLYLAAYASATADTWATEIGAMIGGRPRLVTTLKKVDSGVSGAVSLAGLFAAALGSAALAFSGWLAWPARSLQFFYRPDPAELLAIAWAGFLACILDSVLGATIQAQYKCSVCQKLVERPMHCNQAAKRVRGWSWVNNDVVNVAGISSGVLFAYVLLRFFAYPV